MDVEIIWDLDDDPNGNVQHIAEHDLTPDEVNEVLQSAVGDAVISRTSGNLITFGWTSTGRHIAVVFENVLDDPKTAYPLTAYEGPPGNGSP